MADKFPTLDWSSTNQAESFKIFKQGFELYFLVKKTREAGKMQVLLLAVGEQGPIAILVGPSRMRNPRALFNMLMAQLEPA